MSMLTANYIILSGIQSLQTEMHIPYQFKKKQTTVLWMAEIQCQFTLTTDGHILCSLGQNDRDAKWK